MTTNSENKAAPRTFRIPVSTGIFEHTKKIKSALWLFLYYVDRTTKEITDAESGLLVGQVLGLHPCLDSDAASALGVHFKTIREWRTLLAEGGYIRQTRCSNGYKIEVMKAKKWPGRTTTSPTSDSPKPLHLMPEKPTSDVAKEGVAIRKTRQRQDKDKTETGEGLAAPAFTCSVLTISRKQHVVFTHVFPGIDLLAEYKKMASWRIANGKPKAGDRFAHNWLANARPESLAKKVKQAGELKVPGPAGDWK